MPQASTGFSPFELVYGQDIRGPLDVLKEGWQQQNPENDIINYVNKVYQRLEEANHIVQESMIRAQTKQKGWYDKEPRDL